MMCICAQYTLRAQYMWGTLTLFTIPAVTVANPPEQSEAGEDGDHSTSVDP